MDKLKIQSTLLHLYFLIGQANIEDITIKEELEKQVNILLEEVLDK